MSDVETSVVIVNTNDKQNLRNCLRSLLASGLSKTEILVVDNASTDNSRQMVALEFPAVRLIESETNLGFAGANNHGIRHSLGRYVVLLNSDTTVTQDWLRHLLEEAKSDSKIGIVGPKLLLTNERINSTGLVFSHRLCNGRDRGAGEIDRGQYDDIHDVLGVCFACALIKRRVIDSVGLLDEKTFLYSEDLDYCIRTRLQGNTIHFCPGSVVYHRVGATRKKMNKAAMRLNLRNRFRCLIKNYEVKNLARWGSYSLAFNLVISPIACLRNHDFVKALVCFYVVFWNFLNFPVRERVKVQTSRIVKDSEIFRYSIPSRW